MFNNFLEYEYKPYHEIYLHQAYKNSIFLGDISAALDIQFVRSKSIKTVVTAAIGMDQVSYDQTINHIIYPLLDMKSENITKFFTQFYDLIEKQIPKGSILVHCAAGISRSATLVISYLMKKHRWGFKQTIKFVREKRATVCPNLGFQRQLKQYELSLSRQANIQESNLRMMPKSSQARKHVNSPLKVQLLPQIGNFGHTQIMRSKALQKYQYERFNKNIAPFTYNKNRVQFNTRKIQPDGKFLKKKTFLNNNNNIFQENQKQSSRAAGQPRNLNLVNMFNVFQDERNMLQVNSIPSKKLSSLSHRSQRVSQQSKKLRRNYSNNKNGHNNSHIDDISNMIVNKLNLHQKHFVTQKILGSRPLYKLANF